MYRYFVIGPQPGTGYVLFKKNIILVLQETIVCVCGCVGKTDNKQIKIWI